MKPLRLLYRADGGHPIGTGHIRRAERLLRALAGRCDLDARVAFAVDPFAAGVIAKTPTRPVVLPPRADLAAVKPCFRAESLVGELEREQADVVIVDMLDTGDTEMSAVAARLAAQGGALVTFDDRGPGRLHADLLINILVEEPDRQSHRTATRLLEGPQYVVLDPAFALARGTGRAARGPVERIFVAMGGADAAGLTVKVARALRGVRALQHVEFVGGPAFPHRRALDEALAGAPWEYGILEGLPNLIEPYRSCDLAVVAGGLTMYEVCCVGTPALAVCQPIDHQLELADRLAAEGAMATVGWGIEASEAQIAAAIEELSASPDHRRTMAERGLELVDGRGTERVADAILALAAERRAG